jgi:hypothetical protein
MAGRSSGFECFTCQRLDLAWGMSADGDGTGRRMRDISYLRWIVRGVCHIEPPK